MKHFDMLIIDDEKKFADMLAKRICLRGFNTQVCYTGQSALDWVKKCNGNIDLVLLDLRLPDIYGTQVLKRLKKEFPQIPVIILTGHGTSQDQLDCEQLGAYMFIYKPLNIDKLILILGKIKETDG